LKATNGPTALMLSSRTGHKEAVRVLLEAGAAVNAADSNEVTTLMMASGNGQTETVRVLAAGAGLDFGLEHGTGVRRV